MAAYRRGHRFSTASLDVTSMNGTASKPRVLYVSHTGLMSGAERALVDLLEEEQAGPASVVACPYGPLSLAVRRTGATLLPLPPITSGGRLRLSGGLSVMNEIASAGQSLRKLIRSTQPVLVHSNSPRAGLVSCAALTGLAIPHIVHCHDTLDLKPSTRLVRRLISHSADRVLAVSASSAAFWRDSSIPVAVVYNPLATERFDPARFSRADARRLLDLEPTQTLIGVVGQITPWKGQHVAIEAMSALAPRFPNLQLIICGDAKFRGRRTRYDNMAYMRELRRMAAERGLTNRIQFWPELQDVELLLRALDMLLAPSRSEPFGRSIIEAMSLTTPVIATCFGGPPEYIRHQVTGILADPRDTSIWVAAVTKLLSDPESATAIGQNGSVSVRMRFDRTAYAQAVGRIYSEVLSSPSTASAP